MAALLPRDASLAEHLAASGAKNPDAAAAALAEEEIESIKNLLLIDPEDLLDSLHKFCDMKLGSANKVKSYCAQFRGGGGSAAPPPAPTQWRGGGAAEEALSSNANVPPEFQKALEGLDQLEEMLDSAEDKANTAKLAMGVAKTVLKLVGSVPGVGSLVGPLVDGIGFLQNLEKESADVIEILRQFLSMLRFIAELPATLDQLTPAERSKVEREMKSLLKLVEEFKNAIFSLAAGDGKKGTMCSRMYRCAARTAKAATTGIALVFKVATKISTFFNGLKDMLSLVQNRAILQNIQMLSKVPSFPMLEAAQSQIVEFRSSNAGATEEDAVAALEADPHAVQVQYEHLCT